MNISNEVKKEIAVKCMEKLDIYKPYIREFKNKGTITMFENFGGFYVNENQHKELYDKVRQFELKNDCLVFAITHEYTGFGELYDFMYVSDYEEDNKDIVYKTKQGNTYVFAYVWNKSDDFCSEFGSIEVKSFSGGIKRIG